MPLTIRKAVLAVAADCGARAYSRNNPNASKDEAWRWGFANWSEYRDLAIDILAIIAVDNENQKAVSPQD